MTVSAKIATFVKPRDVSRHSAIAKKMQSIEQLIPKNKGDNETAEQLFGHSYEEVKSIIPALLEWIQDQNWPVAYPVCRYLATIAENLNAEIEEILNSNDSAWKNQVIRWLVDDRPLSPEVRAGLARLRDSPSLEDIAWELPELAEEILCQNAG